VILTVIFRHSFDGLFKKVFKLLSAYSECTLKYFTVKKVVMLYGEIRLVSLITFYIKDRRSQRETVWAGYFAGA